MKAIKLQPELYATIEKLRNLNEGLPVCICGNVSCIFKNTWNFNHYLAELMSELHMGKLERDTDADSYFRIDTFRMYNPLPDPCAHYCELFKFSWRKTLKLSKAFEDLTRSRLREPKSKHGQDTGYQAFRKLLTEKNKLTGLNNVLLETVQKYKISERSKINEIRNLKKKIKRLRTMIVEAVPAKNSQSGSESDVEEEKSESEVEEEKSESEVEEEKSESEDGGSGVESDRKILEDFQALKNYMYVNGVSLGKILRRNEIGGKKKKEAVANYINGKYRRNIIAHPDLSKRPEKTIKDDSHFLEFLQLL